MNVKILILIGMISLGSAAGAVARLSTRASIQSEPSLRVGLLHRNTIQSPTPYPTPRYDPTIFIPPVPRGKTVAVGGPNLADKIQAAQDDPTVATVRIESDQSQNRSHNESTQSLTVLPIPAISKAQQTKVSFFLPTESELKEPGECRRL